MEVNFDSKKYLSLVLDQIKSRVEKTPGKLYVEINGKLLKDDFAERIFTGYDPDFKKNLIAKLKPDLDIFVCVNAKHIIENTPMTQKERPYTEHTETTLKRIENQTGIKPHLIITNINLEEMYDLVFTFEKRFQKKGYRVRENYHKKGFPLNKKYLLSEDGFWNDDHIPLMKKIAFVTGIGNESGKLSTCISQIYQDHQIGIASSFCMFQTLPLSELPKESPINQARAKKRENEVLTEDDFWETIQDSSQESFTIIKNLLTTEIAKENLINSYKKVSDMIICPTLECIEDVKKSEELAKKELDS